MSTAVEYIVVFGAGAIGSLYAAKLATRHRVSVVARPAHAEAIARHGLRVVGQEQSTAPVESSTSLTPIAPRTLVLLTTKVNANAQAAEALADAVRDDTIVLCIQNGLNGEDVIRAKLGGRGVVLRAVTQCGAIFREPGVVDFKVAGPTLIESSPVSAAVADLLTACGLDGRVSEDIRLEVWKKLVFNCVINPITSILGTDVGSIKDVRLNPIKRLVIDECLAVAAADGVDLGATSDDLIKAIGDIFGPSRNIASMRQDLLKGKPTEIEFLNGAVVALGRTLGIDCPVNAALAAIVIAMASRARFVDQ